MHKSVTRDQYSLFQADIYTYIIFSEQKHQTRVRPICDNNCCVRAICTKMFLGARTLRWRGTAVACYDCQTHNIYHIIILLYLHVLLSLNSNKLLLNNMQHTLETQTAMQVSKLGSKIIHTQRNIIRIIAIPKLYNYLCFVKYDIMHLHSTSVRFGYWMQRRTGDFLLFTRLY